MTCLSTAILFIPAETLTPPVHVDMTRQRTTYTGNCPGQLPLWSKPGCHLPLPSSWITSGSSWLTRTGQLWSVGDTQQWLLSPSKDLLRNLRTSGTLNMWPRKLLGCLYVTDQHHRSAEDKTVSAFHAWKRWLRAAVFYSPFTFCQCLPGSSQKLKSYNHELEAAFPTSFQFPEI